MTRLEKLIHIAQERGACPEGLRMAWSRPSRIVIQEYGNWIMSNMRRLLHRRELWRVVKINPAAAVAAGWQDLPQDMRDWILDHEPELVVRFPQRVEQETLLRYAPQYPKTALTNAAHRLPPEVIDQIAVENPNTALAYAPARLRPETFWTCVQKSDRWTNHPPRVRVTAPPPLNKVAAVPLLRPYHIIHARGGWHLFLSHRAMSPIPTATAREARRLAIEDAKSQVLVAQNRIIQFAAGDRPRYTVKEFML